jgi:hypothetical protein
MHWLWQAAKQRATFIRQHPLWMAMILVIVIVLEPAINHFLDTHRCAAGIIIPGLLICAFTGVAVLVVWRYRRSRQPGYCPSCGHKLQVRLVEYCPECGWMNMRCTQCGADLSNVSEPKCPRCGEHA